MEQNRREFLKKSAIVGGAVWVAPAITTVTSAVAGSAATCPCQGCHASATATILNGSGLLPSGLSGPATETNGCGCGPISGNGTVTVDVACAKASDSSCSSSSFLAGVAVTLPNILSLSATALSSCVSCGTGSSFVTGLSITVGGNSVSPGNFSSTCNNQIVNVTLPSLATVTVVFNEQTCSGGVLTVNALHIHVTLGGTTLLDVILGQATGGGTGTGCTCTACSGSPTCTPAQASTSSSFCP
jgi:hypothetical protein